MPTTKAQNYTPVQVQEMREQYEQADTQDTRAAVVASVAADFGKSTRSIISKMSREGFYIPKEVVSKVTGGKPAKKEDLAVTLREISGLPMVSAEKLNKTDIQDLNKHFVMFNKLVSQVGVDTIAEAIACFDEDEVQHAESE